MFRILFSMAKTYLIVKAVDAVAAAFTQPRAEPATRRVRRRRNAHAG